MLPIMTGGRENQRKEMISDAMEAKAPKMYQELKKTLQLPKFLTDQEKMLIAAFREEQRKLVFSPESEAKPGENPIQQVARIERHLLQAWNETVETYLDFSDENQRNYHSVLNANSNN